MRFLSADFVLPVSSPVISNGVVAVREDGSIDGVYRLHELSDHLTIEKFQGILCPGFVNAHCHLELSFLKDKIQKHTGLAGFIDSLLKERNRYSAEFILTEATKADEAMFESGISAVGDISNNTVSFAVKAKSRICYHTFVEVYDFLNDRADEVFENGKQLLDKIKQPNKSITPHATYSVTQQLLNNIFSINVSSPVTIHHDETAGEQELLTTGKGSLALFFQKYMKKDFSRKEEITTVDSILKKLNKEQPLLLVHNTFSKAPVVDQINQSGKKVFWCFCPNANLYIENRLPDLSLFYDLENCCIGTDSLASNHSLSILDEIKTIFKFYPRFTTEQLIKWSTLSGAQALMMENQFGSLSKNKKPGVLLIDKTRGMEITEQSAVHRLV